MHFLTGIRFALFLQKIHLTLDDKFHFCGICIVMIFIGTSRTEYIQASEIGAAIRSYRDANLSERSQIIVRYPHQQLNTVTVIAGFNDHRKSPAIFVENGKYFIQLIYWNFNPSTAIIPKTDAIANASTTNRRIYWLNFAL